MTVLDLERQPSQHEMGILNRCAAVLFNALAQTAELLRVEVDAAGDQLILEYDRAALPAEEMALIATDLAADLDGPYQHCLNRGHGVACTLCADALAQEMARRGQIGRASCRERV